MSEQVRKVKLKVSPAVARVVAAGAPRDVKLAAAKAALPLDGRDLVTVLFLFAYGKDEELKELARGTVRELPAGILQALIADDGTHPQLLDFLARFRMRDLALMEQLLIHPNLPDATLLHVARQADGTVVSLIANNAERLIGCPDLVDAIFANPKVDKAVKYRLGWVDPEKKQEPAAQQKVAPAGAEDEDEDEDFGEIEELDDDDLPKSKYQLLLTFGVSDKIKMALTGDKEWRSLLVKDPNKLVCSAVLKNPRITEGEVLAIARNRSSNDELIRLITLNREWVKNYEIRKALVMHPRTPLPKALRYMATLSEKELKELAKSRNVSQVIVNNARRMLMAKEKRR
ncbi:hypothetical protein EDC39_10128 [Geothermobacter ehrlichii]|uniref:Uncharacterized protein n=1 Tax=Geothermobacter ehrlichii TaxID=213224 RepID=A0A5D3WQK6_9BACT|nr:hypothetical protein [Geothermobacter ehrlichii]TYO99868.1 hypothetical protein EDC39_10128 [Geothermobacter ehrlichii]